MQSYRLLSVNVSNQKSLDDFLDKQSIKYPFNYEYSANDALKLDNHSYDDIVAILFLSGYAIITIYGEDIHCHAGTYIEIMPGITHNLDIKSYIKTVKFFRKNSSRVAKY